MSEKLMSIIVLSWNRAHYTKQTVECLVKKTTMPHEFIFVDNNSTEDSGVRQYLKSIENSTNAKKVTYVFNDKNMGVAGGRNTGLVVASGDYLFNIDDDVLVPDGFDIKLANICDKVPKIGLTGINVEPNKYPIVNMNGVNVQIKRQGNLGGAALCMPRRVFKSIGYYGFGKGTLYGHEDSFLRSKLDILGLASGYIPGKGIHLDNDSDKKYRLAKNDAHKKGSAQLRELSKSVLEMRKSGNIYTPFVKPDEYNPVDGDIFTNEILKSKI